MVRGAAAPLVGAALGLLLLPAALVWLDLARSVRGERHAFLDPPRRVVVLGFDGVDPDILAEYLARDPEALPALARLAEEGTFSACRTTDPPESPVAWATFATGLNPGKHGVFDFLRREPSGERAYQPQNGMVARRLPVIGPLGVPLRPPEAVNLRGGEGFWEFVARAGFRVSVLRMPLSFPAERPRGGELLCGLGVPDLRGTNGSYTLFAAGRDAEEGHTVFGGRLVKIYPRGGEAEARLEGPVDPRNPAAGRRLETRVHFVFTGQAATVRVGDGAPVPVTEGLFGPWVPVTFDAGPFVRLHGLVRFRLLRTGTEPAVYASPIQIAPHAAPLPLSAPGAFAADLAARRGRPMKTAGWPEDTFAANDGVLGDVALFEDIEDTYRDNEWVLFDRLDRSDAALVTMVFTAQDRIAHMYFRYRDETHPAHDPEAARAFREKTDVADPILESYRWMDRTVAATLERLGPRDVLIAVSDHGFHTWRTGVNLNTWLQREGYLVLADEAARRRARTLDDLFRRGSETAHIDWTRTRAYALGLGQIYLNLKGREARGVVEPSERDALRDEIAGKLAELRGPDGAAVFTRVQRTEELWSGPRMDEAPDLQCAFASGYRVSWQTALLGVPEGVFEENDYAWSGDHCSNDAAETAGVFFCNRKVDIARDPGLEDIAPTVLSLFGIEPPPDFDGAALRIE